MLNDVPAAVGHEFGPPAVQCKSQAPPDLLELELELEQIQPHMTQEPMLRGEVDARALRV